MAKMDLKTAYNKVDNLCCSNHNVATLTNMSIDKGIIPDRIDFFEGYNETHDEDFCKDADEMIAALEVIKEVVDLEEQLGCPLDVVFKALKIGIFTKDLPSEKIVKWYGRLSNVETEWYLSDDNKMCINLKGYKKTWWLKKDKSE